MAVQKITFTLVIILFNIASIMAQVTPEALVKEFKDSIGVYYGYELISEKKLSDCYVLLSYLVKFDRKPLRFTFHFYKPDKEWRINSFKYDEALGAEMEESVRPHRSND